MIGIILYEDFASFEIVLTSYLLKTKYDIVTIGNKNITSCEGLKFTTDYNLDELLSLDLEGLIIPGGNINNLDDKILLKKVSSMVSENKLIAAICSGISILQKTNIFENYKYSYNGAIGSLTNIQLKNYEKNENIILDRNVLTAKPQSYIDFAIYAGKYLEIYENEKDLKETINFFKYGKIT